MAARASYAEFAKKYPPGVVARFFPDSPDDVQDVVTEALSAASFDVDLAIGQQVALPVDTDDVSASFLAWLKSCEITLAAHSLAQTASAQPPKGLAAEFNRVMAALDGIRENRRLVPADCGILKSKKRVAMAKTTSDDERLLKPALWTNHRTFAGEG